MNNNVAEDVGHWSSVADSNESPVESGFQENTNAFATISTFDLEEFLSEIGEDDTEREKVENEFAKKLVLYERNVNPDRMIFNINGMIDHWENDDGFLFSYRTELEKLHSHFKFNLEQIWLDRRSPLGREKSTYMTNLFRFGNKILNVLCAPRHLRYSPQRETLLSKCDILFDKIRNCMSKTKNGVDEYIVLGEYITEDILAVITSITLFYSNGSKEVEQIFRCVLSIARNFPVFRQHLLMNLLELMSLMKRDYLIYCLIVINTGKQLTL